MVQICNSPFLNLFIDCSPGLAESVSWPTPRTEWTFLPIAHIPSTKAVNHEPLQIVAVASLRAALMNSPMAPELRFGTAYRSDRPAVSVAYSLLSRLTPWNVDALGITQSDYPNRN